MAGGKVRFDHGRYVWTHGKEPRGRSNWLFCRPDDFARNSDGWWQPTGGPLTLTEAKAKARKHFGSGTVVVMP